MADLLEQLSREIIRDLSFWFRNLENVTRPGSPIRVNDDMSFDVYAFNRSSVEIKDLTGTIAEGAATNFKTIPISIASIQANSEVHLGSVKAKVIADPNDLWFWDTIAKIKVNAIADLSNLIIRDKGVLFTIIRPA
ncbi:hypothetical protein KDU71_07645 [Carboxylicivirga sediminis]|uniref:Uncharacterized protein n=1 Tax=Carboxylicivirga sediminis TaxID=2006564 RepID=A0A941F564_9BACT|nr:hypothetical protein [Carboxylicivirga sediminis]MBR8535430.1 hypothetical protein [Carboxylicivirga sediminis]